MTPFPRLVTLAILVALPVLAQSRPRKVWKWSLAALASGASLDVASSWGRYEANPLARDATGRFSPARGLALKAGVGAGLWLLGRKSPKAGTVANLTAASIWAGATLHNWRTPKAPRRP